MNNLPHPTTPAPTGRGSCSAVPLALPSRAPPALRAGGARGWGWVGGKLKNHF